jgi:thiol:disulfide interchange protein DsbD
MIPITIRLLSNQTSKPIVAASMYASGIVLSYTGLGLAASLSGSLFGSFLANKFVSLGLALMMAFLGVIMLGFGNLGFFQQVGSRMGAGKPSLWNCFLMGTGAGMVAAPCTGPILAGLLALTAQGQNAMTGALLLFIYSVGFAAPYILLGGFAAKATKMRVPPSVQILVKYLFAAVMFGLAFYYLRLFAYSSFVSIQPYLPLLAKILIPLGLILVAMFVVIPRLQLEKTLGLVPTVLLAFGLFAGFESRNKPAIAEGSAQMTWIKSEEEALAKAKAENKPIFIDAWAEWCEACKKMDVTTFRDPAVVELLMSEFIPLKLDLTESTDENDAYTEKYGLQSLPTLVILPSSGDPAMRKNISGYVTGPGLLAEIQAYKGK